MLQARLCAERERRGKGWVAVQEGSRVRFEKGRVAERETLEREQASSESRFREASLFCAPVDLRAAWGRREDK